MKSRKTVIIGLLSHYFSDPNLGCTALSICNIVILDKIADELDVNFKYVILANEKQEQTALNFTNSEYEYRVFPSTKRAVRHPFKLLSTKVFDGCDIVLNLCAGDGFTDIYGKWRTFSESYMTIIGSYKMHNVVLAPQTVGPFNSFVCRLLARFAMHRCRHIFVRDNMSYKLCCQMGQKDKTTEVIDVALVLPYKPVTLPDDKLNVGVNVSGLLYNDDTNRFGLSVNYKEFVHGIVDIMLKRNIRVHLISHVLIPGEKGEDDFSACRAVHELYPETVLVKKYFSPFEVKGYIAGLDMFTGARMHATIASISSGVPVIPIAYSRKVNGLYGCLKYPYYVDAKDSELSTNTAVDLFSNMLDKKEDMKLCIEESKKIYTRQLDKYAEKIKEMIVSL